MRIEKSRLNTLLAALLMGLLGILLFSSAGRDDVYKSYWAAEALSEFGALVNYNGEPVEQSSSLLQVLILALLRWISGIPVETLGPVLSLLAGMAALGIAVEVSKMLLEDRQVRRWIPWLIGSSPFLVYWSVGGIDASLAAFCFSYWVWSLMHFLQSGKRKGHLVFAGILFLMVRPEAFFVGIWGLVLISLVSAYQFYYRQPDGEGGKNALRRIGLSAGLLFGVFLLLGLFRLWIFGQFFPQPVAAKSASLGLGRLYLGMAYLFRLCLEHWEFLLLFMLGGFSYARFMYLYYFRRPSDHWVFPRKGTGPSLLPLFVLSGMLFSYGSFILLSGGDWMEGGRFVVPALPLIFVFAAYYLGDWGKLKGNWILLLLIMNGMFLLNFARNQSTGNPITSPGFQAPESSLRSSFFERHNRIHARDLHTFPKLKAITTAIAGAKDEAPLLMSAQAGMLIHHLSKELFGRIEFVDLLGLSTRHLSDCPLVRKRGSTYSGLNMDYTVFFDQFEALRQACPAIAKPDIIFDLDTQDRFLASYLSKQGYVSAWWQYGEISTNNSFFPGTRVRANQFILIKKEWADLLKEKVVLGEEEWKN